MGMVRIARHAPGYREVTCSEKAYFSSGLYLSQDEEVILGFDFNEDYPGYTGSLDDVLVTTSGGAQSASQCRTLATDLGIIINHSFDTPSNDLHQYWSLQGIKNGGLHLHGTAVDIPGSTSLYHLTEVPEFTICTWVKPTCPDTAYCGELWSLRNRATGEQVSRLSLLSNGHVEHLLFGEKLTTEAPSWAGCYRKADGWYNRHTVKVSAMSVLQCSAACSATPFFAINRYGPCLCSEINPRSVLQQVPDYYCGDKRCFQETSTVRPASCGGKDYISLFSHTSTKIYTAGEYGKSCPTGTTPVLTKEECSLAAEELVLYNATVNDYEFQSQSPSGCNYKPVNARLYFNPYDTVEYDSESFSICKKTANRVWSQNKWMFACASLNYNGIHSLHIDGKPSWIASYSDTLRDAKIQFSEYHVITLGSKSFFGFADQFKFSRISSDSSYEGNQHWRLDDLNRLYSYQLLNALSTGLIQWKAFDYFKSQRINVFISRPLLMSRIRRSITTFRVRFSGEYINTDIVVTSQPLTNISSVGRDASLRISVAQEYGNDTYSVQIRNGNNLNKNSYVGSCPEMELTASSSVNYTLGEHVLRHPDNSSWMPSSGGKQEWIQWSYSQYVSVIGFSIKGGMTDSIFSSAVLEYVDRSSGLYLSYYSIIPDQTMSDTLQYFPLPRTEVKSFIWRLVMSTSSINLLIDYAALELLGFTSECGSPSRDCSYVPLGKIDPSTACNNTLLVELSSRGSDKCRDICNNNIDCLSYSHHASYELCRLYSEVCTELIPTYQVTGWVTWTHKTGCGGRLSIAPSTEKRSVDFSIQHHGSTKETVVIQSSPGYSRGNQPLYRSQSELVRITEGYQCLEAGFVSSRMQTLLSLESCVTYCHRHPTCGYCSPDSCDLSRKPVCYYRALKTCATLVEISDYISTYNSPLYAKPSYYYAMHSMGGNVEPGWCDISCQPNCLESCIRKVSMRKIDLAILLNSTVLDRDVYFGIEGEFRVRFPDTASSAVLPPDGGTASSTATLSQTISLSLPTGSITDTHSLSESFTSSLHTDSFTPSWSYSGTITKTLSLTLPSRTKTFSFSEETITVSDTETSYNVTTETGSLSLKTGTVSITLPTDTKTFSMETDTVTWSLPTVSTSLSQSPTPTRSWFVTSTISLTPVDSDTVSLSKTFSLSLPTASLSDELPEMYSSFVLSVNQLSTGINITEHVHELEAAVYDLTPVDEEGSFTVDLSSACLVHDSRILTGNFESSGEARFSEDLQSLMLTLPQPNSTGGLHLSGGYSTTSVELLLIKTRFGIANVSIDTGTELNSGNQSIQRTEGIGYGGGFMIALHNGGPILPTGNGYVDNLVIGSKMDEKCGVFLIIDSSDSIEETATVTLIGATGSKELSEEYPYPDTNYNNISKTYKSQLPFNILPGDWIDVWLEFNFEDRTTSVFVAKGNTTKPSQPELVVAEIAGGPFGNTSTEVMPDTTRWITAAGANGCGELTITAAVGFYGRLSSMKDTWKYNHRRQVPWQYHAYGPTELSLTIGTDEYLFGFYPVIVGGSAQVTHSNGTTLFSGVDIGFTLSGYSLHWLTIKLRPCGIHTFSITEQNGNIITGLNSWSVNINIPGWYSSSTRSEEVTVQLKSSKWGHVENTIDGNWYPGGAELITLDTTVTVCDTYRGSSWLTLESDYHKAKLISKTCTAGSTLLLNSLKVTKTNNKITPLNTPTELLLPASPSVYLYRPFLWFPRTEISISIMIKYTSTATPQCGLFSYSSSTVGFSVVDVGGWYELTFTSGPHTQTASFKDVFNPITTPVNIPDSYGVKCSNHDDLETVLGGSGGYSFSTHSSCLRYCKSNRQCTVCSVHRCVMVNNNNNCKCSFRALTHCDATMLTGCSKYPISKKSSDWMSLSFHWRSHDGCWRVKRNEDQVDSGCNLATGWELPGNGIFILGQKVNSLGDTDTTMSFNGVFSNVKLYAIYNPTLMDISEAHWPLSNNSLLDVSGNHRHLSLVNNGNLATWQTTYKPIPLRLIRNIERSSVDIPILKPMLSLMKSFSDELVIGIDASHNTIFICELNQVSNPEACRYVGKLELQNEVIDLQVVDTRITVTLREGSQRVFIENEGSYEIDSLRDIMKISENMVVGVNDKNVYKSSFDNIFNRGSWSLILTLQSEIKYISTGIPNIDHWQLIAILTTDNVIYRISIHPIEEIQSYPEIQLTESDVELTSLCVSDYHRNKESVVMVLQNDVISADADYDEDQLIIKPDVHLTMDGSTDPEQYPIHEAFVSFSSEERIEGIGSAHFKSNSDGDCPSYEITLPNLKNEISFFSFLKISSLDEYTTVDLIASSDKNFSLSVSQSGVVCEVILGSRYGTLNTTFLPNSDLESIFNIWNNFGCVLTYHPTRVVLSLYYNFYKVSDEEVIFDDGIRETVHEVMLGIENEIVISVGCANSSLPGSVPLFEGYIDDIRLFSKSLTQPSVVHSVSKLLTDSITSNIFNNDTLGYSLFIELKFNNLDIKATGVRNQTNFITTIAGNDQIGIHFNILTTQLVCTHALGSVSTPASINILDWMRDSQGTGWHQIGCIFDKMRTNSAHVFIDNAPFGSVSMLRNGSNFEISQNSGDFHTPVTSDNTLASIRKIEIFLTPFQVQGSVSLNNVFPILIRKKKLSFSLNDRTYHRANQAISIPPIAVYNSFSILFWFKAIRKEAAVSRNQCIITLGGRNRIDICINTGTNKVIVMYTENDKYETYLSEISLSHRTGWNHISVIHGAHHLRVYLNSEKVDDVILVKKYLFIDWQYPKTTLSYIGRTFYGYTRKVLVYYGTLTISDIKKNFIGGQIKIFRSNGWDVISPLGDQAFSGKISTCGSGFFTLSKMEEVDNTPQDSLTLFINHNHNIKMITLDGNNNTLYESLDKMSNSRGLKFKKTVFEKTELVEFTFSGHLVDTVGYSQSVQSDFEKSSSSLRLISHYKFGFGFVKGIHIEELISGTNGLLVSGYDDSHYKTDHSATLLRNVYFTAPLNDLTSLNSFSVGLWFIPLCEYSSMDLFLFEGSNHRIDVRLVDNKFIAVGDCRNLLYSQLSCDVWNHLILSISKSSVVIFTNGKFSHSCKLPFSSKGLSDFGSIQFGADELFSVRISDIKIWESEMSSAAVRQLWRSSIPESSEVNLVSGVNAKNVIFFEQINRCAENWKQLPSGGCVKLIEKQLTMEDSQTLCDNPNYCNSREYWDVVVGNIPTFDVMTTLKHKSHDECRYYCCSMMRCVAFIHTTTLDTTRCKLITSITNFYASDENEIIEIFSPIDLQPSYSFEFEAMDSSSVLMDEELTTKYLIDTVTQSFFSVLSVSPADDFIVISQSFSGTAVVIGSNQSLLSSLTPVLVSSQLFSISFGVYPTDFEITDVDATFGRCLLSLNINQIRICNEPTNDLETVALQLIIDGQPVIVFNNMNLTVGVWTSFEITYDGTVFSIIKNCVISQRETISVSTKAINPITKIAVGDGTSVGEFMFDRILITNGILSQRHVSYCGSTLRSSLGMSSSSPVVISNRNDNQLIKHLISGVSSSSVWIGGGPYSTHEQFLLYKNRKEQLHRNKCPDISSNVVFKKDGSWDCISSNYTAEGVVCHKPQESDVSQPPVVFAQLPMNSFHKHDESSSWSLVMSQSESEFFPRGRYQHYEDDKQKMRSFLHIDKLDWNAHRFPDGMLQFKLSFIGEGSDDYCASSSPSQVVKDIVWKQDSNPMVATSAVKTQILSNPFKDKNTFDGLVSSFGGEFLFESPNGNFSVGRKKTTPPMDPCIATPIENVFSARVELAVRRPRILPKRNPFTVAFWVRARTDGFGVKWKTKTSTNCNKPTCDCQVMSSTAEESFSNSLNAEGVTRYSLFSTVTPSLTTHTDPGTLWSCQGGIPEINKYSMFKSVTRKYSIFEYIRDGQTAPDISLHCEGDLVGKCQISTGQTSPSTENPTTLVIDNIFDGEKWTHFAVSWEGLSGCYKLYANGKLFKTECGHRVGATVLPGGKLFLSQLTTNGIPDMNGGLHGALTDFTLWDRIVSSEDIIYLYNEGATVRSVGDAVLSWPLSRPFVGRDIQNKVPASFSGSFLDVELVSSAGRKPSFKYLYIPPHGIGLRCVGNTALRLSNGITIQLRENVIFKSNKHKRNLIQIDSQEEYSLIAVYCKTGQCHVSIGGIPAVSFPDVGLSRRGKWTNFIVSVATSGIIVFVNDKKVPTRSPKYPAELLSFSLKNSEGNVSHGIPMNATGLGSESQIVIKLSKAALVSGLQIDVSSGYRLSYVIPLVRIGFGRSDGTLTESKPTFSTSAVESSRGRGTLIRFDATAGDTIEVSGFGEVVVSGISVFSFGGAGEQFLNTSDSDISFIPKITVGGLGGYIQNLKIFETSVQTYPHLSDLLNKHREVNLKYDWHLSDSLTDKVSSTEFDVVGLSAVETYWKGFTSYTNKKCTSSVLQLCNSDCDVFCESISSCKGYSVDQQTGCCQIHYPGMTSHSDVSASLTPDGYSVSIVRSLTTALWTDSDVTFSSIPLSNLTLELLGSSFIKSTFIHPENTSFTVTVTKPSWLFILYVVENDGGLLSLLNNTESPYVLSVPPVSEFVNQSNNTIAVIKKYIPSGEYSHPSTTEKGTFVVFIKGVDAGIDDQDSCNPQHYSDHVYYAKQRSVHNSLFIGRYQCGRDSLIASIHLKNKFLTVSHCQRRCFQLQECSYFSISENGVCEMFSFCEIKKKSKTDLTFEKVKSELTWSTTVSPPTERSLSLASSVVFEGGNPRLSAPISFPVPLHKLLSTIEMWLFINDDITPSQCVFSATTDNYFETIGLYFNKGGWLLVIASGEKIHIENFKPIKIKTWHHIALQWNEPSQSGSLVVNDDKYVIRTKQKQDLSHLTTQTKWWAKLGHSKYASQSLSGNLFGVRIWSEPRTSYEISGCRLQSAGPYHKSLLRSWVLMGNLEDSSGYVPESNLRDLKIMMHENSGLSWNSHSEHTLSQIYTLSQCSRACVVQGNCVVWSWNRVTEVCVVSSELPHSYSYDLSLRSEQFTGRFRGCPNTLRQYSLTDDSLLTSLPTPLPTSSHYPLWWYFPYVSSVQGCSFACDSIDLCNGWSYFPLNTTCYCVSKYQSGKSDNYEGEVVSGKAIVNKKTCDKALYNSVTIAAVNERNLHSAMEAKDICGRISASVPEVEGSDHLSWIITEVRHQLSSSNTSLGTFTTIGLVNSGEMFDFSGNPLPMSSQISPFTISNDGLLTISDDSYLSTAIGENITMSVSTVADFVVCEITSEPSYIQQSVLKHSDSEYDLMIQDDICKGDSSSSCSGQCAHGECKSALSTCECFTGFYPENDCRHYCSGIVINSTCVADAPIYSRPATTLDDESHILVPKAVFRTIPVLYTEAFHVKVSSQIDNNELPSHSIKVTRAAGRGCYSTPKPASPVGGTTYVGIVDSPDDCEWLVDRFVVSFVSCLFNDQFLKKNKKKKSKQPHTLRSRYFIPLEHQQR